MALAESNDDLVNHLLYNSAWKQESLVATCNRRALFRFSDVESRLTLDSTSKPSWYHNMDIIDEKYESKSMCGRKKKTYVCRWCSLDEGKTLKTSRAYRTSWFRIECSMLLAKDELRCIYILGALGSTITWLKCRMPCLNGEKVPVMKIPPFFGTALASKFLL